MVRWKLFSTFCISGIINSPLEIYYKFFYYLKRFYWDRKQKEKTSEDGGHLEIILGFFVILWEYLNLIRRCQVLITALLICYLVPRKCLKVKSR